MVDATCPLCRHTATLDPNDLRLPNSTNMNTFGHAMRCTGCNRKGGINVYPVPKEWVRHLRATVQMHRMPWFSAMMSGKNERQLLRNATGAKKLAH